MGARRRRRRWDDAPLALSWMQAHTLGQPDTLSAQTAPATPKKGRILDRETTKETAILARAKATKRTKQAAEKVTKAAKKATKKGRPSKKGKCKKVDRCPFSRGSGQVTSAGMGN